VDAAFAELQGQRGPGVALHQSDARVRAHHVARVKAHHSACTREGITGKHADIAVLHLVEVVEQIAVEKGGSGVVVRAN
jgi:hypothetical protein